MSSNIRYNAKRDIGERDIIRALEKIGCTVEQLNGTDIPDLLVERAGMNWLLEVKSAKGKLEDGQQEWHSAWRGQATVVHTPQEAVEAVTGG